MKFLFDLNKMKRLSHWKKSAFQYEMAERLRSLDSYIDIHRCMYIYLNGKQIQAAKMSINGWLGVLTMVKETAEKDIQQTVAIEVSRDKSEYLV